MARDIKTKREHPASRDHRKAERLQFIDEELFRAGEITRRSIEETFGVSEETAKADLRDYRRGYARDLRPDRSDHIYRVPIDFVPRISNPGPESYLFWLIRCIITHLESAMVPCRSPLDRSHDPIERSASDPRDQRDRDLLPVTSGRGVEALPHLSARSSA